MELFFTKIEAAGNDYIYLDCRKTGLPWRCSCPGGIFLWGRMG